MAFQIPRIMSPTGREKRRDGGKLTTRYARMSVGGEEEERGRTERNQTHTERHHVVHPHLRNDVVRHVALLCLLQDEVVVEEGVDGVSDERDQA